MSVRRRRALGRVAVALSALVFAVLVGMGVTSTSALAEGGSGAVKTYTTTAEMDEMARSTVSGDVKVSVDAPEDAFDRDVTLHARLLCNEADTQAVANELDKAEVSYDGFAAMDISFMDADGNEVEPAEAVDVKIELPEGFVPEGAKNVTVQHLVENLNGDVEKVEAVADAADEAEGSVEVADSTAVTAEFSVDGFSGFVISWSGVLSSAELNVRYGTLNNGAIDELEVDGNPQVEFSRDDTIATIDAPEIDGYDYTGTAYVVSSEGGSQQIYDLQFSGLINWCTWQYTTNESSKSWQNLDTEDDTIYFIYESTTPEQADFYIDDQIIENGTLVPTFADSNSDAAQKAVTYKWYKSDSQNGTFAEVSRRKVTLDSYNITDNGNALYPSFDAGARQWYYVEAYDENGMLLATSAKFQVPLYNQLQNGSFETPALTGYGQRNPNPESGQEGIVWRTTAEDNQIEIIRVDKQQNERNSRTWDVYGLGTTADGDQVAELNANMAGALYQDVLTVPGSTLTWQLSHRARNRGNSQNYEGNDTMYVIIMSTGRAAEYTSQDQIDELVSRYRIQLNSNGSYYDETTGIGIWKITDGATWAEHSDQYVVPAGQHATRFFFASGETSFDKQFNNSRLTNTVGNFLDDVSFGERIPEPNEDEVNFNITKTVVGLTDQELRDYQVTVSVVGTDGTNESVVFSGPNLQFSADGQSASGTLFVQLKLPANSGKVTYTISESSNYEGNKVATASVSVDEGSAEESNSATVVASGGSTYSVAFTNAYEETFVAPTVYLHKYDAANTAQGLVNATFEVTGPNDSAETVSTADGGYVELGQLAQGEYTITEIAVPAGYQLDTTEYKLVVGADSDGNATVTLDGASLTAKEDGAYKGSYVVEIANVGIDPIPSTGGIGNAPLYLVGIAAIAGSVIAFRKRHQVQ